MGRDSTPSRSQELSGSPQWMLMRRSLLSAAAASHSVSSPALLGLGVGVSHPPVEHQWSQVGVGGLTRLAK
jgi:hypothetical protein